jgi:hypothetical protein
VYSKVSNVGKEKPPEVSRVETATHMFPELSATTDTEPTQEPDEQVGYAVPTTLCEPQVIVPPELRAPCSKVKLERPFSAITSETVVPLSHTLTPFEPEVDANPVVEGTVVFALHVAPSEDVAYSTPPPSAQKTHQRPLPKTTFLSFDADDGSAFAVLATMDMPATVAVPLLGPLLESPP